MKSEIQLVEEAAITCSYCQSNAHSRTVQPFCKLDRYMKKTANLGQCSVAPNRRCSRDPTSSIARPICACWDHTAFLLS